MKKQNFLKKTDLFPEEDSSGGSSGSSGSGIKMVDFISTPQGEARYEVLLEKLRKGEAKKGAVILPSVKQSRVQRRSELSHDRLGRGIKPHPKLNIPRFNGQDTRINQRTDQNVTARNEFLNQLQLAFSHQQKLESSKRFKGG